MADIIEYCMAKEGENITDRTLLQCALHEFQNLRDAAGDAGNNTARAPLLVLAASGVFFMQAGFAMVCAGAVRKKNVQNTMMKNLLDACGSSLAFFAIGYGLAFGGSDPTSPIKTFMGNQNFFLMDSPDLSFWVFQFAFSAASATIVAGALAERCQMVAYVGYSIVLTGWVYPIVAHAVWDFQGFLSASNVEPLFNVGMIDFSGSGVVHVTGGVTSIIAAAIIGPRRGRFHDELGRVLEVPNKIRGHSPALQMLGTFILWFGWYSFNGGSALQYVLNENTANQAALAATNSTVAAGTASMVALLFNSWLTYRTNPEESFYDLQFAMNGCLAGLVSITAGCALIEPWAGVVVGSIAGIIFVLSSRWLVRMRIDDAVDAVPIHLFCGIWGVLSVGLFSSPTRQLAVFGRADHPGLFYSLGEGNFDATLLGVQAVGLVFIICWVCLHLLPFFFWLDHMGWLRCDALEELVGLDAHQHGELEPVLEGREEDEVSLDHLAAYKRRRDSKNAEILRKRSALRGSSSFHVSDASQAEVSELADNDDGTVPGSPSVTSREK